MQKERGVLSVAGLDPSGGAGLFADIKTFEQIGVYGLGVCTALTYQNDVRFSGLNWLSQKEIEFQLAPLAERFEVRFAKIGLVPGPEMLASILTQLNSFWPDIKIIWDPVLKASAGFDFENIPKVETLKTLLQGLYLLTPNKDEILKLLPGRNAENAAISLSESCNILLKGGHDEGENSTDILYTKGSQTNFSYPRLANGTKHGSGCVLSSAISAFLELGFTVNEACSAAKDYTYSFLQSSETLIGSHKQIETLNLD